MFSRHNDHLIKESISDATVPDAEILELFRQFVPSYTLDYAAPACLGISCRRPRLAPVLMLTVAEDYFQLGVLTAEQFARVIRFALHQQADILMKHGDELGLLWLRDSAQAHFTVVGERLAQLEIEFQQQERLAAEENDRRSGITGDGPGFPPAGDSR